MNGVRPPTDSADTTMTEIEIVSLAIRAATLLVAVASLGVAVAALRTVKAGIMAMTTSAAQRAAEHDRRHVETMARFDQQHRALETLIARTAPAPAAD